MVGESDAWRVLKFLDEVEHKERITLKSIQMKNCDQLEVFDWLFWIMTDKDKYGYSFLEFDWLIGYP